MDKLWKYAVAGNIKKTRIDENGVLRYGTPAFKGNTKVYLSGRLWDERLPGDSKADIAVLGLSRGGRYYVGSVPVELIENVRLTTVYKPKVLEIMNNFEFRDCWWGNTQEERDDASAFVARWNKARKKELNEKLLKASTAERIDLNYIEQLLKDGANPLGLVGSCGDEILYNEVLYHFLNMAVYDEEDDSEFFIITELFVKYGMDISNPEVPYNGENILNPLWSFAFYDTDAAMQALKLLLDNGLDAYSAGLCWSHDLTDMGLPDFKLEDDSDYKSAVETFRKVMLIASYPHIIDYDEALKKEIWFSENNYDIKNFRNWDNFEYVIEPTDENRLNRSVVRIFEKSTKKEVWKFGFEISPEEIK